MPQTAQIRPSRVSQVMARSVLNCRPWIARRTAAGVNGMSMFVIPIGESASMTALTIAAGDPTPAVVQAAPTCSMGGWPS